MVVEYIYNKDTFVWLLTDTAGLSVRKFLSKLLLSSVRTVYLVPRLYMVVHTYLPPPPLRTSRIWAVDQISSPCESLTIQD